METSFPFLLKHLICQMSLGQGVGYPETLWSKSLLKVPRSRLLAIVAILQHHKAPRILVGVAMACMIIRQYLYLSPRSHMSPKYAVLAFHNFFFFLLNSFGRDYRARLKAN